MIYLDHNATAPLLPEVLEAMLPWLRGVSGNASSLHAVGRRAKEAVEAARVDVGALVGGDPAGVHFCSGGTEADVWALRNAFPEPAVGGSMIISAVEHPAVRNTAAALAAEGVLVREIDVDSNGRLRPFEMGLGTGLVAVMAANNETGNLHPVAEIAKEAAKLGAWMHSDLVQAAGKVPVNVDGWGLTTAALSAHKLGGPQGVGALWVRPGTRLAPMITGGGQEGGARSGTENVAGIVGFGAAARRALLVLDEQRIRLGRLRDEMSRRITAAVPGTQQLGDPQARLPNTLSLAFRGLAGEALVMRLDAVDVAASTGSACSSGSGKPSHVLLAMGLPAWQIKGAVRLSLGATTTKADAETATQAVISAAIALQAISAAT
jgi:cysteine desulfurase